MPKVASRNQPLLTHAELQVRLGEFYRACREFNDGYYFESHETLEDLWMVTPWPERQFFQAVIQLAAAYVHFARGEFPGILKLLDASAAKLADFRPEQFGVDVERLHADVLAARGAFATLGEARLGQYDEHSRPLIVVVADAAATAGDLPS